MMWQGLVAVLILSLTQTALGLMNSTSVITREDGWSIYPCLQLNHREAEIPSSLTGQWYVIATIQHTHDPRHRDHHDTCPKLNLYKPTASDIRLMWHDKAGDAIYNFRLGDPENAGFWLSWTRQTGSMVNHQYKQFAGSVQVIEAEPSRMVLTFCSQNRSHYSVVMVRNITIQHDTSMTRQMLANYGLQEVSLTVTCKDANSASVRSLSYLAVLLSAISIFSRLN